MLTHLDRYKEASASFQQAVNLEPNAKDAWLFLGVAFHHIGKYKQAYACYDKALGRKPDLMREALMQFESTIKRVIAGIFQIKFIAVFSWIKYTSETGFRQSYWVSLYS